MLSRSIAKGTSPESGGIGAEAKNGGAVNRPLQRIVVCTVTLAVLGLLVTTDATVGTARYGGIAVKQLALFPLAGAAFMLGYWVRPRGWQWLSTGMMLVGVVLLAVVLFPGLSHASRGSTRWINIGGFTFHPMECFKFGFIVFAAHMLSGIRLGTLTPGQGLSRLLLFFFLGAGLIALEPDVGSIIILVFLLMGMALTSGALGARTLMKLALAGLLFMAIFVIAAMNLRGSSWGSALSTNKYDVAQAKYAIASGGLIKLAPGSSVQKYYIPEPHNDFAFAILAEELGALGAVVVILLYVALVFAGLDIARRFQGHPFEQTLAMGISLLTGGQAFLNMGVASGLLPVSGLPLPLISYGYTALVMNMLEFGILARLAHEAIRAVAPKPQAAPAAAAARPAALLPPPAPLRSSTATFFSSLGPRDSNRGGSER